jgi:hypothetical protein
MRFRIFISSVQSEFAQERRSLKAYLLHDPLLRDYVSDVFLFEDTPAVDRDPAGVFFRKSPRRTFSSGYSAAFTVQP